MINMNKIKELLRSSHLNLFDHFVLRKTLYRSRESHQEDLKRERKCLVRR